MKIHWKYTSQPHLLQNMHTSMRDQWFVSEWSIIVLICFSSDNDKFYLILERLHSHRKKEKV